MQIGIFTVGDVTPDPTTGRTPTEHERIRAMTTIAEHAEAVGLDVFATGEHHNLPFVPSSPTTLLGHGPSLEEFAASTPLTVGSPQQVVDKTLTFREFFGDYQRQLFLVDHAGLPLKTVLEQLDLLGGIAPELRRGFEARRPPHVPADPPTHANRKAARDTTPVG